MRLVEQEFTMITSKCFILYSEARRSYKILINQLTNFRSSGFQWR